MSSSTGETALRGFPFGEVVPMAAEAVAAMQSTGWCLQFSGTAGWADVPADVSHLSSDAATFEAWISTSATPEAFNGQVIYIGKNGDGASPRISVDASSRIKVYWSSSGSGGGHASTDTRPIIDGHWHHVAVVFDHGAITFYKDGQPTTEQAPVSMPGGQPAGSPCQIGAGFGDATGFTGQIFDLRAWTRPRSGDQIRGLMYGAVDGSLTQQLNALKQQGLLIAASFDSGGAPVNLVSGATGDLHDCTIAQTTPPGNKPDLIFGPSASDVEGVWNVMTDETSARMQSVRGSSKEWQNLVEDQMQLQGFISSLQTSGDEAWGDAIDTVTKMPLKTAKWIDHKGVVHTIQCRAAFTPQQSSDLAADPVPTGGGATAQLIYNDRNEASLVTQRVEHVTNWVSTGSSLAFLVSYALTKGLTKYLNTLKSNLSGGVEWLSAQEKLAVAESDEAFAIMVTEDGVKAAKIFEKASVVVAIFAALVDGVFRLFHPTTMSVSMWNETDLDLEWSLGYLNDGSYWMNSDKRPNGDWRPFPKKSTINDDTAPIFGPVYYPSVAAVNLAFANDKLDKDIPLADQPINQCILIRKKGSTGDPYVLLLSAPLVGSNSLGMGTGKGDEEYFDAHLDTTPSDQLVQDPTFTIDGTDVDFHLVTDALKGQTTYAGFQGYNYNTLLYIKTKTP